MVSRRATKTDSFRVIAYVEPDSWVYPIVATEIRAWVHPESMIDAATAYQSILEQTAKLRNLIDAITSPQYRHERGNPELRPYESLLETIRGAALQHGLPLATVIDDPSRLSIISVYPLTIQNTNQDAGLLQRQIILMINNAHYQVTLSTLHPNQQGLIYELLCVSLVEAAVLINQWLVEHISFETLIQSRE